MKKEETSQVITLVSMFTFKFYEFVLNCLQTIHLKFHKHTEHWELVTFTICTKLITVFEPLSFTIKQYKRNAMRFSISNDFDEISIEVLKWGTVHI